MKSKLRILGSVGLFVLMLTSCNLFTDVIVGSWQQSSVNGTATVLVTKVEFTAATYSGSIAGVTINSGTWTKAAEVYTLNGAFFGFISSSSTLTPTFSNWNNTLTFTDSNGYVEVYNRQ